VIAAIRGAAPAVLAEHGPLTGDELALLLGQVVPDCCTRSDVRRAMHEWGQVRRTTVRLGTWHAVAWELRP
jgi:hypothetical protein